MGEKSVADIIQFHKILIGLNLEREFDATLVAIDMSKAFDTINRVKLMNIMKEYTFTTNCDLLELLTTLSMKIGQKFSTNRGVPQCDGLSPKLFTFYVDHALRRFTERFCPNNTQLLLQTRFIAFPCRI